MVAIHGKYLFVDDLRSVVDVYDVSCSAKFSVVRDIDDAKNWIIANGIPEFISFDHDLDHVGHDTTGYALAKWIVDQVLDGTMQFPKNFRYQVHSANPVGRANIIAILDNFLRFCCHEGSCHNCIPADVKVKKVVVHV